MLYWYATNQLKWALKDGIGSLLKYKDRAYAIMQRCKSLITHFGTGGPSRYLGAYWLKIPLVRAWEKSKANFEAAIQAALHYLDNKLTSSQRSMPLEQMTESFYEDFLKEVAESAGRHS